MAVALEKTFVVNNLSRGFDGQLLVSLVEQTPEQVGSTVYIPTSTAGLTVSVDESDASKFLPGQLFKVALTPVKSA